MLKVLVQWLIEWPRRLAGHLTWLAPLFARIVVGWVFLLSGWGKLMNLPTVTEDFVGWGIPRPEPPPPLPAGALGVTMLVAIKSAKWADVDSLETLLGFDETEYLALFLWLAIAGAGAVSLDWFLERKRRSLMHAELA